MRTYPEIPTIYKRGGRGKFLQPPQYATTELEYLAECEWEWTEKVDGMNIRVLLSENPPIFGGKTDKAQLPVTLFRYLDERFRDARSPDELLLFGEGYGAGSQKGGLYHPGPRFVLFDAWCGGLWLLPDALAEVATAYALDRVPVIGSGTLPELRVAVERGFRSKWGEFPAEGIVARPVVQLLARDGERIITKLKTRDFYPIVRRPRASREQRDAPTSVC